MVKIFKTINKLSNKQSLILVLSFGLLMRLIILIGYGGITHFPDSENYIDLAKEIYTLDFSNYEGRRTPGYPGLIALAQNNLTLVIAYQLILGLLSLWLLFMLTLNLSSKKIALITCLTFSCFYNIIYLEFAILTETLTHFLLLLSIWYINKCNLLELNKPIKHYLILGLILSLTYLTKPLFIYVPLGFFIYYVVKNFNFSSSFQIIKPLLTLLVCVSIYFGWNNFNQQKIGHFTNTQYFGINLAQTATPFFEKADNKDALIRDIVVKHRDSILKENPKALAMSVWFAQNELKSKTNLTDIELSFKLGEISKQLFKNYPLLYAKQVGISWFLFWGRPHLYVNSKNYNLPYLGAVTNKIWFLIMCYIVVVINVLFILFSLFTLKSNIKYKHVILDQTLFIICIILAGSLGQALVAFGSNPRFCMPFFSLIIYVVVLNIFKFTSSKNKS